MVFDEAHKLRNFYKGDNKTANLAYKRLLDKKKKALKFDYSSKLVFDCTFEIN